MPHSAHVPARRPPRLVQPRRGVALILTMILTVAFAAMAMGAIYMTGNAALIGSSYDRERDYRYGAEAALGIAKSQLSGGLFTLPDSGYTTIMSGATITGADGAVVPRVLVNLYAGPTGSTSGQDGSFASIVAEATDGSGARYVRRLELAQETFAKFAYFSVREKFPTGGTIVFGGGDVIYGPVFSNDTISINTGTCPVASFRDQVQTAKIIKNPSCAAFSAYGYQINMPGIPLPTDAKLATLSGYASPANFLFTALTMTPYVTPPSASYTPTDTSFLVTTRLEFTNWDIGNNGSVTDPEDGFFRVVDGRATPITVPAALPAGWSGAGMTGGDTLQPKPPTTATEMGRYIRGDPVDVWTGPQATAAGLSTYLTRWDTVSSRRVNNCGDWHTLGAPGFGSGRHKQFFPLSVHRMKWFRDTLTKPVAQGGPPVTMLAAGRDSHTVHPSASLAGRLMRNADGKSEGVPRCYLGGDPHLVAIERYQMGGTDSTTWQKGGSDTTFTASGRFSAWRTYPGTIDGRLTSGPARRNDANYLFPLYRGINPGSRGVIQVDGSIGVSGVVRGRITMYASGGNIVIVDNTRYAISPAGADCLGERDILGLIASRNVTIADNALLDPQAFVAPSPSIPNAEFKSTSPFFPAAKPADYPNLLDPTTSPTVGLTLHAVIMTLDDAFRNEGYRGGSIAATAATCGTSLSGRGCLNLTGGLLMDTRGIVALLGQTGYVKRYAYDRCAATRPPPYFPTTGRYIDNRFYEIDPVKFNRLGVTEYFEHLTAGR